MRHIKANTFAELYYKTIKEVYENPDFDSAPRGMKIREGLNFCLELTDVTSNLFKCDDKSLTLATGYIKKEVLLYLLATNSAKEFSKASSFWDKIKNPDGETINSAYGNLIFNPSLKDGRSQFDWAFDQLKNDKDSRQAIMRFNNTSHQFAGVKDFPCTFVQLFHIRDNKLYSTVEMRSNDVCKGLAYDVPSFLVFMSLMYSRLKEVYTDLQLGTYTHISNSMHVYESDFELTKKRIDIGLKPNAFPFPIDWRCIKSSDVNVLLDVKLNKQDQLFTDWKFSDNKPFYDWILK